MLVLFSPAKFCMELSTKIVYLPKAAIERTLQFSLLVATLVATGNAALSYLVGTFNIFEYFTLATFVVMGLFMVIYIWFTVGVFTVYEKMERLVRSTVSRSTDSDTAGVSDTLDSDECATSEYNSSKAHSKETTENTDSYVVAADFSEEFQKAVDIAINFSYNLLDKITTMIAAGKITGLNLPQKFKEQFRKNAETAENNEAYVKSSDFIKNTDKTEDFTPLQDYKVPDKFVPLS